MRAVVLALLFLCSCSTARASDSRQPVGKFYLIGEIRPQLVPFVEEFLAETVAPEIVLSTHGGDMNASIQIAELIAIHGNVRCLVRGQANSGGFAILQACRVRSMKADAKLVTHEPRIVSALPIERNLATLIQQTLESLAPAWNARCQKRLRLSAKEYETKVRGRDWGMDSREALMVGAVDAVIP